MAGGAETTHIAAPPAVALLTANSRSFSDHVAA